MPLPIDLTRPANPQRRRCGIGRPPTPLIERLAAEPGIAVVESNASGCVRFELPPDRVGDLIVVSDRHVVLGTSRARHDLSGLTEPLRSHGGISEQEVPLLFNRRTAGIPGRARLRNYDIFDVALNHLGTR
jgi:phosphonoacetate hydrolase